MSAKIVAMVDAELIVDADGLLYLPKRVHWYLPVGSCDIRLPEDEWSQTIRLISTKSSDGVTQSFDAIKFDARYRISIDHRVDRTRSSAVVHN